MAFKIVIFAAVVAVARAGVIAGPAFAAPIAAVPAVKTIDPDFDPNPQYSYAYDIQDALTGDSKNHQESRNGDLVQGQYSLVDSDGTRRIVDYTADPVNGFNAVVRKEPLGTVVAAKVATPVLAAPAPVIAAARFAPAPIAYPAPLSHYPAPLAPLTPVAKIAAPFPAYVH